MTVLNAALLIARAGLSVFPCGASKRPAIPKSAGGRGFHDATADERESVALFGVPTGERSGFDVLDFDYRNDAAAWAQQNAHRIPVTREHRTMSGGKHLLFRHAPGVRNLASKFADGMDVRGDGGYIIAAPSRGYSVENDAPTAEWPAWCSAPATRAPADQPAQRG